MRLPHGDVMRLLPRGSFAPLVARRHVDLLRVNSALCPGELPAR
jgi:hypothetical protein